ncbi:hypothetical protein WJX74_006813 [Apatococcus lobatus]|uniref:Uncharacterized protein n=1 Tax=Apatococcus lobatus TaxID=904363 RepID=A0AAW1SA24_9CHLO
MPADKTKCGAASSCRFARINRGGALRQHLPTQHQCKLYNRIFCALDCFKRHTAKCADKATNDDFTTVIDHEPEWKDLRSEGVTRGRYNTGLDAACVAPKPRPTPNKAAGFLFIAAALGTNTVEQAKEALRTLLSISSKTLPDSDVALANCYGCNTERRIAPFVHTSETRVIGSTAFYCLHCKGDVMRPFSHCDQRTMKELLSFMHDCPSDKRLIAASDHDMDQRLPKIDTSMWNISDTMSLEQLWDDMYVQELEDKFQKLSAVKQMLNRGNVNNRVKPILIHFHCAEEFPLMDECQTVKLSESMLTPLLGKYGKSKPLITVHRLLSKVLAIQGDAGRMALNVLVEDILADLSELTQVKLERVSERCHDKYCKAEDVANAAEPSDRSGLTSGNLASTPSADVLNTHHVWTAKLKLGVNIRRPHADASPDVVSGSEGETTESEGEASSDGESATNADEPVRKGRKLANTKPVDAVMSSKQASTRVGGGTFFGPNFARPKRNAEGEFKDAVSHGTVLAADVSKALAGEESIFDGLGTSPCVGMGKFIPEGKDVGVSAVHEEMVQAYEAYTTKMSGCMDAMRGAIDQGVTAMPQVVDEEGVVREELIEAALNALSRTVKQEDMAKFITAVLSAAVAMQQKLRS